MVSLINTETEISIDPDRENKMRLLTKKKIIQQSDCLATLK